MKITGVYISLDCQKVNSKISTHYEFISNYLSLFISAWIKKLKLDLGKFNRFVFEEGERDDLSIAGDRAFVVCLEEEFEHTQGLNDKKSVHNFFVRKYLEGFSRVDKHFGLNLTEQLREVLATELSDKFEFESKVKSKKEGDLTVLVVHRYKYDSYDLVVRVLDKNKEVVEENVLFSCDPDPFKVHFDVNKVEIDNGQINVINKVREKTLVYDL